jgi:hypothetical protein
VHPAVRATSEASSRKLQKVAPAKSTILSQLEKLAHGTKSVSSIAKSVAGVAALAATIFS